MISQSHFDGFQISDYDASKHRDINKISRLPPILNPHALQAYSELLDCKIRSSLIENGQTRVVEDSKTKKPVAAYSSFTKTINWFGTIRDIIYVFDFIVSPDYRNKSISHIFTRDQHDKVTNYQKKNSMPPLITGSFNIGNTASNKISNGGDYIMFADQKQTAWQVTHELPIPFLPPTYTVHFWKEENVSITKKRWEIAFRDYNFCPIDWDDILVRNSAFYLGTYVLELRYGTKRVSQASLSLWNQDLIFTMKEKTHQSIQKHHQIFSCYSTGPDKDLAFKILLTKIHNMSYRNGVNYLFAGFYNSDPMVKHFPLIGGIKDLDFCYTIKPLCQEDRKTIIDKKNQPIKYWNDCRDQGVVLLFRDNISKL
eukprot:gene1141-1448_t